MGLMLQTEARNKIAGALVAVVIFAQMVVFGSMTGLTAAVSAVGDIMLCLGLIVLLAKQIDNRLWVELGPVMCLFLAALAWAAAPLMPWPWLGWTRPDILAPDAVGLELLKLVGAGAACLVGCMIGFSRSRLQQFMLNAVVIGLAYTLLALWVGQASPFTVWGQPKGAHTFRFTGTFLNANAAGCLFGMLGLLSLALLQSLMKRTDPRRAPLSHLLLLVIVACSVVAAFGACVLTQSRASLVLAGLLGVLVVAGEALRSARGAGGGRAVMVLTAIALGFSLLLGASQISSRWNSFSIDARLRADYYLHYIHRVAQAPWFGCGLGGFRLLHEHLLTPGLAAGTWDFGAAHSAMTQAALEGGLPFLLLLAGAVGLIVARIVAPSAGRSRRGAVMTGVIAALLLAFSFSFVDIALNVPAIIALTAILLGAAWGDALSRRLAVAPRPGPDLGHAPDARSDRDWISA
jgi:hypothetical protein